MSVREVEPPPIYPQRANAHTNASTRDLGMSDERLGSRPAPDSQGTILSGRYRVVAPMGTRPASMRRGTPRSSDGRPGGVGAVRRARRGVGSAGVAGRGVGRPALRGRRPHRRRPPEEAEPLSAPASERRSAPRCWTSTACSSGQRRCASFTQRACCGLRPRSVPALPRSRCPRAASTPARASPRTPAPSPIYRAAALRRRRR